MGRKRLRGYWKRGQQFLLHLPPGQQDELTAAFETLKATCKELLVTKWHWHNWISNGTWLLIRQRTSLRRAGQLRRAKGTCMQCAIHSVLKLDQAAQTAQAGNSIVAELAKGNVQEAFRHLKGWYQTATETQAKPCFLTMEKQTAERVDLYRQCDPPGDPVVITVGAQKCRTTRLPMGIFGLLWRSSPTVAWQERRGCGRTT